MRGSARGDVVLTGRRGDFGGGLARDGPPSGIFPEKAPSPERLRDHEPRRARPRARTGPDIRHITHTGRPVLGRRPSVVPEQGPEPQLRDNAGATGPDFAAVHHRHSERKHRRAMSASFWSEPVPRGCLPHRGSGAGVHNVKVTASGAAARIRATRFPARIPVSAVQVPQLLAHRAPGRQPGPQPQRWDMGAFPWE